MFENYTKLLDTGIGLWLNPGFNRNNSLSHNKVIERFRRNLPGFWAQYYWFIILFLIGLLCDAVSTIYFMLHTGKPDDEIHLVIRFAAKIFGPVIGPLLGFAGKALCGLIVCIYLRRWTIYILTPVTILSFWAAWYNIWGYKTNYIPNIFRLIPW